MAVRIVMWDWKVHLGGINAALGFGRPRKMVSVTWATICIPTDWDPMPEH